MLKATVAVTSVVNENGKNPVVSDSNDKIREGGVGLFAPWNDLDDASFTSRYKRMIMRKLVAGWIEIRRK